MNVTKKYIKTHALDMDLTKLPSFISLHYKTLLDNMSQST